MTTMLDETQKSSRRSFLHQLTVLGTAGVVTPAVLSGCGGERQPGATAGNDFSCQDVSGLTQQEIAMRNTTEYTDETPNPQQRCDNCQLWEAPPAAGQCGGCQVIAGPIHPNGWCTLWVAQV